MFSFRSKPAFVLPTVLTLGASLLAPTVLWGAAASNLTPEGDFETAPVTSFGAIDAQTMRLQKEGNNQFLRLTNENTDKAVTLQRSVALPADVKWVVVSALMRAQNLKLGAEGWHEARIALRFEDEAGQMKGGYPAMPNLRANSDWVRREVVLPVPEGAKRLVMQPGLWLASGQLDLDNITVKAYSKASDLLQERAVEFRPGFPEGRFEDGGPKGTLSGWTQPSAGVKVVEAEGARALQIRNPVADGELFSHLVVPIQSDWATLNVKFQAQAQEIEKGSEGWKQARVFATMLDENGQQLKEQGIAGLGENTPRREFSTRLDLPENARWLRLSAGLDRAAGTLMLANLVLQPAGAVPLTDAVLPANQKLNWGQEEVKPLSATRGELSLNGLWKFLPAEGPEGRDPKVGWGYIRVPGSWKRNEDIVAKGEGRLWQTFNGDRTAQAWYQRTIKIPASWDGRSIAVKFQRVSTDAFVTVNGQDAGAVRWPAGEVDITPFVKAGKEATLRLRVIATDDRAQVPVYMGYVETEMKPAQLDNRGIIGNVSLVSRPRGARVQDVFVRPSTRQKKLNLDVELENVATAGNLDLTAILLNEKGVEEKRFSSTLPVKAGANQTVTASWDWANPRLWDVGQPNLYTLRLEAKGAGISDELVTDFGFREFWIEGRKFFLNNTELRLRPANLQYGRMPSDLVKPPFNYFNFGEIWPYDRGRRGSGFGTDDAIIADADKVGIPIAANALHMGDWVKSNKWDQPATQEEYQRIMEMEVRRWRNHPSVVMYAHTANALQWTGDGNPWLLGKRDFSNIQEYVDQTKRALEATAMIKALDPTRPVYAHHGTYNGDVYTSNLYLNFIPLQEREEWISEWARNGQMPYIAIEFGLPLYASVMRTKDGYTPQGHSEPFMTEWVAREFGAEAYTIEPERYRSEVIAKRYKGGDLQKEYDPHIRHDQRERILTDTPGFHKLLDLYITNTWRSWRTMGITGGMIPWHNDDHPALRRVNGPSLAWIAGPGEAPEPVPNSQQPVFTAKDHSFPTGTAINKQLVLINDHREPKPFDAKWTVTIGGKTVTSGSKSGTLGVSQNLFLPLRFTAPATINGEKVSGQIKLSATVGPDSHEDTFDFRVFRAQPRMTGTVTVFDPVGDTTRMLRSLGYTVKLWTAGAPPRNGVVVIGREALSSHRVVPGDLAAFVRGGGRLLVMAQDPQWTNYALQLRTAPQVTRRVFPVGNNHPVLAGLDAEDLRDWRGSSHLVKAYPHYPGFEWTPLYGWKWGNRGGVSSAPIEKPHRSSWRPILETEFDLAYTPLMEMEYGRGRIVFSTLDLEDHASLDPAAGKLARQLMTYVASAPLAPKAATVSYLGDDAGAALLDDLGVVYTRAQALQPSSGLVIVGSGAGVTEAVLRSYLQNGGKVLFLASKEGNGPLGAKLEKVPAFLGSLKVPSWAEARGLSVSDLRSRVETDAWLLKGGAGWDVGAEGMLGRMTVGKGVAVAAQIDPRALSADDKRYLRFTRWRQTRALSQVLANLGATFKQDARMVELLQRPEQAFSLAGEWDAQLTLAKPESPTRQWNSDPGITDAAKALVSATIPATAKWEKVILPGYMESFGPKWRFTDGEVVYRREVTLPPYLAGKDLFISLGRVDETEETFFNGESVGKSRSWLFGRGHRIPGRLVKAGKNVIAIRTWDEGIHGGISGAPETLNLRVAAPDAGFYHPDYISDDVEEGTSEEAMKARYEQWKVADNPYRYYRW